MKLIVAIISYQDANRVQKELIKEKFTATRLATTGGFLRARNATFLLGVNDDKVPDVLDIIERGSKTRVKVVPNTIISEYGSVSTLPTQVQVGGATIFVITVDQFLKV
ncbi:cyclic-di-AMP receptor [Acholeplasma sp. OttesenSCG-928-E16]|nr:cyclic-di-AMP receptor [Acholeplasma sp. OttesenSCG-928-E16]